MGSTLNIQHSACVRILFPFIACTHDNLCRRIRDYYQSFGKGYRIIRRAEFLEEIRWFVIFFVQLFHKWRYFYHRVFSDFRAVHRRSRVIFVTSTSRLGLTTECHSMPPPCWACSGEWGRGNLPPRLDQPSYTAVQVNPQHSLSLSLYPSLCNILCKITNFQGLISYSQKFGRN